MAVPKLQAFPNGKCALPNFGYRNGVTKKGVSKRRYVSDPMPTVLEKIMYKKLQTPKEFHTVEFVVVMQALKQNVKEFAKMQTDDEVDEGVDHGDGEEKICVELPQTTMNHLKEIKEQTYDSIAFVCLFYTIWKKKASEIIRTVSMSSSLKVEVTQFENEISRGIEMIRKYQQQLEDCYTLEMFEKINGDITENIRIIDESINARKDDIQLELDMCLDKVNAPSLSERMCFLLGLELDAYNEFEEMDENIRNYHSPEEWFLVGLENHYKYLEDNSKSTLTVEVLLKLDFSEHAANALVNSIPAQERTHLSTIDWVVKYIKNQFKYHILLSPGCPSRFPFRQELTKTWFTLQESEMVIGTSECDITKVHLINLVGRHDESFKTQGQTLFSESSTDEESLVFFHGTDHSSAVEILRDGIDLRKGRGDCDFSYMKGFYLGNKIEDAINWSYAIPKAKPAVLIFKVEQDWLRQKQFLDLTVQHSIEDWKNITQFYHSGAKNKHRRGELNAFQFIEGPKVARQRFEETGAINPIAEPDSYQLCITCEEFAEEFDQKIHSILFFDKDNTK